MLKKLILGAVCGMMISSSVSAATMKVEALTPFSTEHPTSTITLKLLEDCELSASFTLVKGDVLSGETTDVVSPKRLKRNASFSVILKTYTDKEGKTHSIKDSYVGKYALPIDKKELAKTASLAVGSYFVKGLSLGVNAVQGAVQNEEGNRLKSSVVNVYENSPLSYVETGSELNIKSGDTFLLKFNTSDEDDEPNYEYTLPNEEAKPQQQP